MHKLRENLLASLEGDHIPIQKIAVCYHTTDQIAKKIAQLLPYPSILIDSVHAPLNAKALQGITHAIELYSPKEPHYDMCRAQRTLLHQQDCLVLSLYDWQESYLPDDFWGDTDYHTLTTQLYIAKQELEKVDGFHITSALGTDITFSVKGRQWMVGDGICRKGKLSQMPDGEIYTCPVEESFTGIIVVDGTITRSWVPLQPERLEFKQGKLISCSPTFEKYIEPYGPAIYQIGEFALGFNPAHRQLVHNISVDEKAAGTVHFALGDSYNLGKSKCNCHLDMVVTQPIITTIPTIKITSYV